MFWDGLERLDAQLEELGIGDERSATDQHYMSRRGKNY